MGYWLVFRGAGVSLSEPAGIPSVVGCYVLLLQLGGRIKGTLGDIDPLNKVPLERARSRVQKGYPLRGLPNTTP